MGSKRISQAIKIKIPSAKNLVTLVSIAATFSVLFIFHAAPSINDKAPTNDADNYVVMGYNIQKHGIFSLETSDSSPLQYLEAYGLTKRKTARGWEEYSGEERRQALQALADLTKPYLFGYRKSYQLTHYREPGFPAFLALVMTLDPNLHSADLKSFRSDGQIIKRLKNSQLLVLLLTSIMTAFFIFRITKSLALSLLALVLVGLSSSLLGTANSLLSENVTALLLFGVSFLLFKAVKEKKIIDFSFLGIGLGFLSLTKAIFVYFFIFVILFLIFLRIKGKFGKREFSAGILSFSIIFIAIVGTWMVRNYSVFRTLSICARGGHVLLIRSNFDMMTAKEFLGSFFYWTPNSLPNRVLSNEKIFGTNILSPGGSLEGLNDSLPTGYFQRSDPFVRNLIKTKGLESPIVDKTLMRIGVQNILGHPFRHCLVTLPLAWRGLFIENGIHLNFPVKISPLIPGITSLLYMAGLILLCILSLKKRLWHFFAFILPALYLYSAHSFLTENEPRFNFPMLPVCIISLALGLHLIFKQRQDKR